MRVLIVDDDADVRAAATLLCSTGGHEVVGEAANGRDAIALAAEVQPDVVVLDYMMPQMDGALAAGVIRAVSPGSHIIAFSAIIGSQPDWADSYINKADIATLPAVIAELEVP